MDLIAQVIGAVFAFFASIIGNIFANDICTSANAVCAKIIKAAAARLATFDQTNGEQEWLADLHERQTVSEKYRHAIGCYLVAPRMKSHALNAPPPLLNTAPGFVWVRRQRGVWEGRWRSSAEAIEKGYVVKSVKLYAMSGNRLDANHKEFIIHTACDLQAELNQWLRDHDSSDKIRT